MALDFPNSPTNGQQFTGGAGTWQWDTVKWVAVSAPGGPYLPLTGGSLGGPGNLAVGGTLGVTGAATLSGGAAVTGTLSAQVVTASGNISTNGGYFQTQGSTSGVYIYDRTVGANSWLIGSSGGTILQISENTPTFASMVNIINSANLGQINPTGGYKCQPGNGGTPVSNIFNINWTGAPILWIDGSNIGTIQVTPCDARAKTNIQPSTHDALAAIKAIDIVSFDHAVLDHTDHHRVGFTAQQLAQVVPEAVHFPDDPEELAGVQLLPIVAHLLRAVQQLDAKIAKLERK